MSLTVREEEVADVVANAVAQRIFHLEHVVSCLLARIEMLENSVELQKITVH